MKLIERAVEAVHVSRDGTLRKISFDEKRGMYYTILPDKKQIHAKSKDLLYKKLFEAYGLTLSLKSYTIGKVFQLAFDRKISTSTNKSNSFRRNMNTFKTYFNKDFAKRDITKITKDDLLSYTKFYVSGIASLKKGISGL